MNRIVIVGNDDSYEQVVRAAFLHQLNGDLATVVVDAERTSPSAAVRDIMHRDPETVVLGPGLRSVEVAGLLGSLGEAHPEVSVMLVAAKRPRLMEMALRKGATGVIAPDAPDEEIRAEINRGLHRAATARTNLAGCSTRRVGRSRIITVLSPKGGIGKTTIATNLAVGLSQTEAEPVVLVDADLQFGDVSNVLNLLPERGIAEANRLTSLDATMLKMFLTTITPTLFALTAPEEPEEADEIEAASLGRMIDLLAAEFPTVVIDTGAGLDDPTLAAIEHSTDLLMVCSTDLPSVRALRKSWRILEELGLDGLETHLVLNRANARVGLSRADVEKSIGRPVDLAVPSSREIPMAINRGEAIISSREHSQSARALQELTDQFRVPGARPAPTRRPSRFRRRTVA